MRKYTLDRWNWSERAQKWVFVSKRKSGEREYFYQLEPPKEFIDLTMEIKRINEKLMETKDPEKNKKLFLQLIDISKKMQNMHFKKNAT